MHKFISPQRLFSATLFFACALAYMGAADALAQSVSDTSQAPVWQEQWKFDTLDTGAFQTVSAPVTPSIVVPTVVEVPVPAGTSAYGVAVSGIDGAFVPALFVSHSRQVQSFFTATENGRTLALITDGRMDTNEEFAFVEDARNTVTIRYTAYPPVTTTELRIAPALYGALPETIAIRTLDTAGIPKTVVAATGLDARSVRFPETTASVFEITLECPQPLRLAELSFVPVDAGERSDGVRFLAQPGASYTVWLNPDRAFGALQTGGADLSNDADVLLMETLQLYTNTAYIPADSDADGIPDDSDNCVAVANPDQRDINRNGRGDECEDFDRDGTSNVKDNCRDIPNRYQEDADHDGTGDACDTEEDRFTERNPWVPWVGMGIAASVLVGLLLLSVREKGHGVAEQPPHASV